MGVKFPGKQRYVTHEWPPKGSQMLNTLSPDRISPDKSSVTLFITFKKMFKALLLDNYKS